MTKDEWRQRYYQCMRDAGVDEATANDAADVGVEVQEGFYGPNVDEWHKPEDAASDELSYWGD